MNKLNNITQEEQQIIDLYNQGLSQVNVGKLINHSDYYVRKILNKYNVHIRDNREQALKYYCDENYFQIIDTEEKAYWLGFIYADGYITADKNYHTKRLGIALHNKDQPHLEKFKQSINSNTPIHQYTASGGFSKTLYCRIILTSNILCGRLINMGVLENKSLILKFPTKEQVPNNLIFHFIRGYFDGDGCITIIKKDNSFKYGVCGTREFLTSLQEIINDNHPLQKRYKDDKNSYSIDFGGNKQVYNQLYKLYENATIYLDRKYERYLLLKNKYN